MSHDPTIASTDLQDEAGKLISRGFLPIYVVLSFLISYVGSWTTLELINRRTSSKGLYNWSILVGAAIAMGGIGIWCMHFIGNRAIVLGDGSIELQITYAAGFTAISFFLPIIVLFMAFAAVGANDEISFIRLSIGGTLAGLGICGMHYLGQAGISNYDCIYYVAYVVGAAIIAIVAATAALGIFFVFRATWNSAWWKRGICALILAGAVSGMHWLASVGTQYRLKLDASFASNNSRNTTALSVIVLSIGGCFILFVSAVVAQATKRRSASRAKQITLASAIFDMDGRLLVRPDGLLPTKTITDSYREKNFDDIFGISHPAFHWMYRASHNWAGISSLIPGMREHLDRAGLRNRLVTESGNKFTNEVGAPIADYSIIFRELFCAAAAELADDMRLPIEKLGIMFDEIFYTGEKSAKDKKDLELGAEDGVRRGQLLFLIRIAGKSRVQQLQSAGYRFAPTASVIGLISGILQIPRDDLLRELDIMREFAKHPPILDAGCHLALFAVRASMYSGFDILARKDARNQLPTVKLPFDTWENWQTDYMKTMSTQTVSVCIKQLNIASRAATTPPKERQFAARVLRALEALKDEIDDPFFNDAILVSTPVEAPCRGPSADSAPGIATLIVFRVIIPIQSRTPGKNFDFTPLAFFKMQQQVYKNSRDHAVFARRVYREFAPVLNLSGRSYAAVGVKEHYEINAEDHAMNLAVLKTPGGKRKRGFFNFKRGKDIKMKGDNSSEKNLVDMHSEDLRMGGIMVSQEVSIDIANTPVSRVNDDDKKSPGIELREMKKEPNTGIVSQVSKEEETPSYVDELFRIAVQMRTVP